MTTIEIDGFGLSTDALVEVARPAGRIGLELAPLARKTCLETAELRERIVASRVPIYGVTTGFGDSASRQVSPERAAALQRNLVRYHLNGTGANAPRDVVRATMLVRANCLARGVSGVRPVVIENLLKLLEADVLPLIPERGSVGASGDLVPLCYLATCLQGEGPVIHNGVARHSAEAHWMLDLAPIVLEAKEGLALINGTSFMSGYAVLAAADAAEIAFAAEICTALAVEVLLGNRGHYTEFLHENKPHPGQLASAASISAYLADSELAEDHLDLLDRLRMQADAPFQQLPQRVQDSYSVRCAPHVVGVLRDTLSWVDPWLTTEINSANDNPLFDLATQASYSGGNFYGGHVGQAMDSLKVATASVADLLDRQLELLVDEKFNNGLPPNLISRTALEKEPGLHHGYKGLQIACSALTAEALKQSGPATIFSRSTEAHNQDKVSMATIAARDAHTVNELVLEVVAIHLHAACQGLELRGLQQAGSTAKRIHSAIRAFIPSLDADRQMDHEIVALADFVRSGGLRRALT